jgi:hypothetical protein
VAAVRLRGIAPPQRSLPFACAAVDRRLARRGTGATTISGPHAPTRSGGGETLDKIRHTSVQAWSEDGAAIQERSPCLWLMTASRGWQFSRAKGGMGTGGGPRSRLDPHRPPDQAPPLLKPEPRHRKNKSECGEEEPKGWSKRGE